MTASLGFKSLATASTASRRTKGSASRSTAAVHPPPPSRSRRHSPVSARPGGEPVAWDCAGRRAMILPRGRRPASARVLVFAPHGGQEDDERRGPRAGPIDRSTRSQIHCSLLSKVCGLQPDRLARSIRVRADHLAARALPSACMIRLEWGVARRAIGVCSRVAGDVFQEMDRSVAEEGVGAAGMKARGIIQSAVEIGVRIEQVAVQQDKARSQIGRVSGPGHGFIGPR